MDMRLIIPIEKAVEAVEVKKELKVPPLHPHYGRKTRPETLERARLLLNLTLHQAVIISSALPQWNNILKREEKAELRMSPNCMHTDFELFI